MSRRGSAKKAAKEMGIDGNMLLHWFPLTCCMFYRQKKTGIWLQTQVYRCRTSCARTERYSASYMCGYDFFFALSDTFSVEWTFSNPLS